jgi:hypothetical protein
VLSFAPGAYIGLVVRDREARWSGIVATTGVFTAVVSIAVVSTAVVSIIAEAWGYIADIDVRSAPLFSELPHIAG